MANTAEPKQLTTAIVLAIPILSGEIHAEPCRHLHVYAAPQCGARKTDTLIVPRPARRRRSPVSAAFPNGASSISSANPCDHGREQALAIGAECQCRGGVWLWQDADCTGEHAGSQRGRALLGPGDGGIALGREMGAGHVRYIAARARVPDRRHAQWRRSDTAARHQRSPVASW